MKERKHLAGRIIGALLCVLATWAVIVPVSAEESNISVGEIQNSLDGGKAALTGETTFGLATAEAVRYLSGCQAVIINGGDLGEGVASGSVTNEAIKTAITNDRDLAIVQITPSQLRDLLEEGVSHIVADSDTESISLEKSEFDGFPQVSGFWFEYDVTAPTGERIMRIELEGIGELNLSDTETKITAAATKYMLSGGYGFTPITEMKSLGFTLSEALTKYIASGEESGIAGESNMQVAGVKENLIKSWLPKWALPVIILVVIAYSFSKQKIERRRGPTFEESHRYQ